MKALRKKLFLLGLMHASAMTLFAQMDISGTWRFAQDPTDKGVYECWQTTTLPDRITLPGSMLTNSKGNKPGPDTKWTADIWDTIYARPDYLAEYKTSDNYKVPFFLQPALEYVAPAWYQRDIDIPTEWAGKPLLLTFERVHWHTQLYIDGIPRDSANALSAPQEFWLTEGLKPGKHTVTLRIDNRVMDLDPGQCAHSLTDHTQGNWNGVAGKMTLTAHPLTYIYSVETHPHITDGTLTLKLNVRNLRKKTTKADVIVELAGKRNVIPITTSEGETYHELTVPLTSGMKEWDEFHPNLYGLRVELRAAGSSDVDIVEQQLGLREWKVTGGQLTLNGHPAFLRGTLHCAVEPFNGYPPTDKASWLRELGTFKQFGLNHVRFHSWCPPEAAFEAADELGMYLQIECSTWAEVGSDKPIDQYVYDESERIVRAYGNHPSFCFMAHGNEPSGEHRNDFLTSFVNYWKQHDDRHLYTSGSGWPQIAANDYHVWSASRIQQWGEAMKTYLNASVPTTDFDWSRIVGRFPNQPIFSHEIGQWCAYPDYNEMEKFTGVYKARNYEIFQESLRRNGMELLADSFFMASGHLQTLAYKADIEAQLRTPRLGGFQLLGLRDFPGQGTALVGALNSFTEVKPYTSAAEYKRFCSSIVPLARIPRLILNNTDTLKARIEVANFERELKNTPVTWSLLNTKTGATVAKGQFEVKTFPLGNGQYVGTVSQTLAGITVPTKLSLEVKVAGHSNDWSIWVYPDEAVEAGRVLVTDTLDDITKKRLLKGGDVLLTLRKGSLRDDCGGNVAVAFSPVFWNTSFTNRMPPHTLGLLCDPDHPALRQFPTDYYADYEWQDAMTHAQALLLTALGDDVKPIVRIIDDNYTNRPMGLILEARVGKGRLLLCGADLLTEIGQRPAARQLLRSLTAYMQSKEFCPIEQIEIERIIHLTDKK